MAAPDQSRMENPSRLHIFGKVKNLSVTFLKRTQFDKVECIYLIAALFVASTNVQYQIP